MKKLAFFALSIISIILIIPVFGSVIGQEGQQYSQLRVDSNRIKKRIMELAEYGKNPHGGIDRVAFSEADIQGRAYIISVMKEAGLEIKVDAAGNIIGRREGSDSTLPPILSGSHTDSVPDGGKYDGALGVVAAIECAQVLKENGIVTRHPLEVVVFTDEEGGLLGSRAMIGRMTPSALKVTSHSDKTVGEGIAALGGNPEKLDAAARKRGDIKAFIEIHIEQGSIIYSKNIDIGIVEGIVGINWWTVDIWGFSNHAGTTPMDMRQDALLAAAHLIIAVNRVVTSLPGRQVGTVGRISCEPGAPNVIPGHVVMSVELRDLSGKKISSLIKTIKEEAEAIAEKTNTRISFQGIDATAVPAPLDQGVQKCLIDSAKELGFSWLVMPSGAGHDAQNMARIAPTGMIFVPSVGGVSHSPKEYTRTEDMAKGANVLLHAILKIDQGALSQ